MNSRTPSIPGIVLLLLPAVLWSVTCAFAQETQDTIESPQWPGVRLAELSGDLVDAVFRIQLHEGEKQLLTMGDEIFPHPVPKFADRAIAAARLPEGQTLDGFKKILCRLYPEYDCEFDIDPELSDRAFEIAHRAAEIRDRFPDRLYLVLFERDGAEDVRSIVGLDPVTGDVRVLGSIGQLDEPCKRAIAEDLDDQLETLVDDLPARAYGDIREIDSLSANASAAAHVLGNDFVWIPTNDETVHEFGTVLTAGPPVGDGNVTSDSDAGTTVTCSECEELGLRAEARPQGRFGWKVSMNIIDPRLFHAILRARETRKLEVAVSRSGGVKGTMERGEAVRMNITILPNLRTAIR